MAKGTLGGNENGDSKAWKLEWKRRLKERRNLSGKSQAEVADEASVSGGSYNSYEDEDGPLPDVLKAARIARAVGTTSAYLNQETDDPSIYSTAEKPTVHEFRTRTSGNVSREELEKFQSRVQQIIEERQRLKRIQELDEEERELRKKLGDQ